MKRIVLCFDGTWNAVTDPKIVTNVVRLANLVTVSDDKRVNQITYYNSGVGSGGPIDRFIGGAFGAGLKANVKRGLAFLALNYDEGDELYLFGFSRGAYTARALAGVIATAGIPLDIAETERHWLRYQELAKLKEQAGRYVKGSKRRAPYEAQAKIVRDKLAEVTRYKGEDVPIRCIGVWDTVGAYGVPAGFGLSGLARAFTYWTRGFRDTRIGKKVDIALHAVAIDEMRKPFAPTFWTLRDKHNLEKDQEVEQVWFPGVHSNIGGGYDDCGLSDVSLAWMIARVSALTDLRFNEGEVKKTVWPCAAGTLYRTSKGGRLAAVRNVLPGAFPLAGSRMRSFWRWLQGGEGGVLIHRINEKVHWSVSERRAREVTLVDGVGKQKYSPPNIGEKISDVAERSELEQQLLDRNRDWAGKCPLQAAGLECECAKRALGSVDTPARPSAAA